MLAVQWYFQLQSKWVLCVDASIFVPDDGLELHATEAEGRVTFDADDPSTGFLNGIKSYFFYSLSIYIPSRRSPTQEFREVRICTWCDPLFKKDIATVCWYFLFTISQIFWIYNFAHNNKFIKITIFIIFRNLWDCSSIWRAVEAL